MRSLFNFVRNDERYVEQVRSAKNRELSIARLSKMRLWLFYPAVVVAVCSVGQFALSCVARKPDFGAWLSPLWSAFVFFFVDYTIKMLKLAQRNEQEKQ